ncbi:hypothetical protein SARC_10990, partial [Sphaeroforma arctica JP610]
MATRVVAYMVEGGSPSTLPPGVPESLSLRVQIYDSEMYDPCTPGETLRGSTMVVMATRIVAYMVGGGDLRG